MFVKRLQHVGYVYEGHIVKFMHADSWVLFNLTENGAIILYIKVLIWIQTECMPSEK